MKGGRRDESCSTRRHPFSLMDMAQYLMARSAKSAKIYELIEQRLLYGKQRFDLMWSALWIGRSQSDLESQDSVFSTSTQVYAYTYSLAPLEIASSRHYAQ